MAHRAASRAAFDEAVPNARAQNGLRPRASKSPTKCGETVPPPARSPKKWLIPAPPPHFPSLSPACSPPRRHAPTAAVAPASSFAPRGFSLHRSAGLELRPTAGSLLRPAGLELQLRPTAGPSLLRPTTGLELPRQPPATPERERGGREWVTG